jgi:hypothetical protein
MSLKRKTSASLRVSRKVCKPLRRGRGIRGRNSEFEELGTVRGGAEFRKQNSACQSGSLDESDRTLRDGSLGVTLPQALRARLRSLLSLRDELADISQQALARMLLRNVPEGRCDRSLARSAWKSVPPKNRPGGYGLIGGRLIPEVFLVEMCVIFLKAKYSSMRTDCSPVP